MTDSVRLAKRLAAQLPCSRREAELYIESGWVTVDGAVVDVVGFRIEAEQKIELAAQANLEMTGPVTLLLHLPVDTAPTQHEIANGDVLQRWVSPASQSIMDTSGFQLLPRHLRDNPKLLPLQSGASGLVIFSQEETVRRKLIEDAAKVEQEYVVEVVGDLLPHGLALLNHGLSWNGRPLAAIKVSWQNETRLRFAVKGVQPNQIKGMCAQVGLTVVSMRRIRVGRVGMGGLEHGTWRFLLSGERF